MKKFHLNSNQSSTGGAWLRDNGQPLATKDDIRSTLEAGDKTVGFFDKSTDMIGILENAGEVESLGPLLRRSGWTPSPTAQDLDASNHLAHDICAGEQEPPSVGELVSRYGSSVPGLLRFLERQGRIVKVEADRYYDRKALDRMIAQLKGKLVPGQIYVPAQLRDVLGFSRKYLIPFLEFCDRSGVTERRGDGRVIRETPVIRLDTSQARS